MSSWPNAINFNVIDAINFNVIALDYVQPELESSFNFMLWIFCYAFVIHSMFYISLCYPQQLI